MSVAERLNEADVAELSNIASNLPEAAEIKDEDQYLQVTEILKSNKDAQKKIDEKRVEIKEPYLAGGRAVDKHFKAMLDPLKAAEAKLKKVIGAWMDKQEAIRRQEEAEAEERARKERQKLEERAAKAADKGQMEKAEALSQQSDSVVASVPAAPPKAAGLSSAFIYEYEIVDASKINAKFMIPDDKKISALVKSMKEDAADIVGGIKVTKRRSVRAAAG